MKKLIMSIGFLLFLFSSAFCQEYYRGNYTGLGGGSTVTIEVCGDTLVDNKLYQFVYNTTYKNDSIIYYFRYQEAIRKEGARVYYKNLNFSESKEYLLYDYDLKVGESLISGTDNDGNEIIVFTVDSIGTININGETKKKIFVRDHNFEFAATEDGYIIEDIGLVWQSRHPLYFVGVGFDHTWLFSCYYNNEELIFVNPEEYNNFECQEETPTEICELNNTSTSSSLDVKPLSIFPNPVHSVLNIATDFVEYSCSVHDLKGQRIHLADNLKELNFSSFPNGVYIISVVEKSTGLMQSNKVVKMD